MIVIIPMINSQGDAAINEESRETGHELETFNCTC